MTVNGDDGRDTATLRYPYRDREIGMPALARTRGGPRCPVTEVAGNERHEVPLRALPTAHSAAAMAESPKGDFPPFVAAVSTAAARSAILRPPPG